MDRLLIVEPLELVLKYEVGQKSCATIRLKNVMYTMPVAFNVQTSAPKMYTIKPTHGIINPLGVASVEIILNPQIELPVSFPYSDDKFWVKSVVVPGGCDNETVSLDWFTAKKKQVFSDHGMKVILIGGGILRSLVADGSIEDIREVLELDEKLVDSRDEQGRTAMHIAVASGRPELVQLLLEFQADLEVINKAGLTALQEAASLGEALIVELLLAKGAKADTRNDSGWTALHVGVMGGHREVVSLLVEHGADVNSIVEDGSTAVHLAVEGGWHECLELLLERGADPDAKNSEGDSALHRAVERGDEDIVELLLRYGANKAVRNSRGKTPGQCVKGEQGSLLDELKLGDELREAALKGNLQELQRCLKDGASPNCADDHGWTPLHRASFKGHFAVAQALLHAGADLHLSDLCGFTPLHLATLAAHKDLIQLLLRHGALINSHTSHGNLSPLDLASSLGYPGIIRLLIDHGALLDSAPLILQKKTHVQLISSHAKSFADNQLSSPSVTEPRMMAFVIR